MKLLLAEEKNGHPFWNRNDYRFFLCDTEKGEAEPINVYKEISKHKHRDWNSYEFSFSKQGVMAQAFVCGSGYGKSPIGEPFVVIPRERYDKVVIIPCEELREAQRNYNGNYLDNSDFEQ